MQCIGRPHVVSRKQGQRQPLKISLTSIRKSRYIKKYIDVGRRPVIVVRASQSPQQSSEASSWVRIIVKYNDKEYPVTLQDLLSLPIDVVKEKVVQKLKEGYDGFNKAKFGNLKLFIDKSFEEEITGGTLMQTSTIKGMKQVPQQIVTFNGRLNVASGQEITDVKAQSEDKQLTESLKALRKVTISNNVLPASQVAFPYPIKVQVKQLKALFVRDAYVKMFDQIVTDINNTGVSCFAISGTPAIGKSLFFIYILHQIISQSAWKPYVIVYHNDEASAYYAYMMDSLRVVEVSEKESSDFLKSQDSLYIMDGNTKCRPFNGISIMLASPRAKGYDYYRKNRDLVKYFFPVWEEEEILMCRASCYASLEKELVLNLYAMFGGVPRYVYPKVNINIRDVMEEALADADAVSDVRNVGDVTKMFPTSHILLHIIAGEKHEFPFQFLHVDFASKYVADQLWERRWDQMLEKMRILFLQRPSVLSGHLFERYGHAILRGKSTKVKRLQCKQLHDSGEVAVGPLVLNEMKQVVTFGRKTIPKSLTEGTYYEASDEDNFPAVDSVTTVGLFQFTVRDSHRISGIDVLKILCGLYKEPALYFVVPPHQFNKFKKQKLDSKDLQGLKQYVVSLPLSEKGYGN